MTLKSMTGYGRGVAHKGGITVEVELSTVNRKQFDCRLNLPRNLSSLESRVREQVHAAISRGNVSGVVRLSISDDARRKGITADESLAKAYVTKLRKLAGKLKVRDDISTTTLLRLPDVISYSGEADNTEHVWEVLKRALAAALKALLAMRKTEGQALDTDVRGRLAKLQALLGKVRKRAPTVARHYRTALKKRLASVGVRLPQDDPALLREMAIYADRSDISEETVRIDSHFKQADKLLRSAKPCGRALDFLCQEFFREINTIGSKANDATIAAHVIRFKAELECIREQVQNIE